MKKIMIAVITCCALSITLLVAFGPRNKETKGMHFNHLAIYVYDLKTSTDFYKSVVGLEQIDEPFKDNKHSWFNMGPHCQLHVISGNKKEQEHIRDTHLSLSVSSIDDYKKRLDALHIGYGDFTGEKNSKIQLRTDGVKQIYFQDPDGYWIEINDDKY